MSNTVIQVENLSKRYQLGTIGYGSLQHDLKAWWAKARGKEDPNTRIGEKSRLDLHGEFWALQGVEFQVNQGDRVGIIGRNGAGKSTLLKLLSRVTSPTTGTIKVKGRIASLLEVGTGFHPELTGRENVFLNGAILGMKRREIQAKFDEIVDFSGVEQFIDTPVKRYSSGMYVKLAFSVASHLNSEILIIDEVLAVGDAAFQKKSLDKMERLGNEDGRTILFVSHQTPFLLKLCNKGILLDKGVVQAAGSANDVIAKYIKSTGPQVQTREWVNPGEALPYADIFVPKRFYLADSAGTLTTELVGDNKYYAHVFVDILKPDPRIGMALQFFDNLGSPILISELYDTFPADQVGSLSGLVHWKVEIPTLHFFSKTYKVELITYLHWTGHSLPPDNSTKIEFSFLRSQEENWYSGDQRPGGIFIPLRWTQVSKESPVGQPQ